MSKTLNIVLERELCLNCLYKHNILQCTSKGSCKTCHAKHHTLLHDALQQRQANLQVNYVSRLKQTLLATAMVPVYNHRIETVLRALIDQGSMLDLLTENGANF